MGIGGYPDPKQTVFVFSAVSPTPGLDQAPVGPLNPFLSPGPALSTFGGFALPFGKSGCKASSILTGPQFHGHNLHLGHLADSSTKVTHNKVHLSEEGETIHRCRYCKDVQRTKFQALTIVRLTHSPIPLISTIFNCQDVKHPISAYIKRPDIQHTISA